MASRYGHAWSSQYGDEPEGIEATVWREDLAGLTDAQIRDGCREDAMRGGDWPPSSARFRALCLGIPVFEVVRRELRPGAPALSPFGRAMWATLDAWRFQQCSAEHQERMARDAYAVVSHMVQRGMPLPIEPEALIERQPPPPRKPASPEFVKQHLDAMAESLGVGG